VRRAIADKCSTVAPWRHCLAYVRHIDDIELNDVSAARNFVDMTSEDDVDTEAEMLLSELQDDVLPKYLPLSHIQHFDVQWQSPKGLDVVLHDDYLNSFCNTFYSSV